MTLADLANIAGALGLLLSVYIFVTSRFDRRPRLDVDLFEDVIEYEDPQYGPMQPENMVFLDVSNSGSRRVKIANKQIELADGLLIIRRRKRKQDYPHFMAGRNEPFWLPPGDSFAYATDSPDFMEWLERRATSGKIFARGLIVDATGNWYRSSWRKFNVQKSEPKK